VLEEPTQREWSVAQLAASGQTNKEVADRLHISAKTVEWTLTKVYRKLRVRSRTELALKLAGAEVRGFPWTESASFEIATEDGKGTT
jgi:DNA-binding NarL/FixJ family response regulator